MIIFPAIDIRNGKVVRLKQGDPDRQTIYGDRPADQAKIWEDAGAEALHVVDLDGAILGERKNAGVVEKIVNAVQIPVQFGGGVRTGADARRMHEVGVQWIVLGSVLIDDYEAACSIAEQFPGKICAGIDARCGKVSIHGWKEDTKTELVDFAQKISISGFSRIIYTDINRDGLLKGVDAEEYRRLVDLVNIPVVASGGVVSLCDIERLCTTGVIGVIVGKALYDGELDLKKAIEICSDR